MALCWLKLSSIESCRTQDAQLAASRTPSSRSFTDFDGTKQWQHTPDVDVVLLRVEITVAGQSFHQSCLGQDPFYERFWRFKGELKLDSNTEHLTIDKTIYGWDPLKCGVPPGVQPWDDQPRPQIDLILWVGLTLEAWTIATADGAINVGDRGFVYLCSARSLVCPSCICVRTRYYI